MRRTDLVARDDLAVAGLLALAGVLEVGLAGTGTAAPVPSVLLVVAAAGVLLTRTSHPLPCLVALVVLVVLAELPGSSGLTGTLVVACLIALGSVGRHCRDRVSTVAAVATIGFFVTAAAFTSRPWDVVVSFLACGAAWGAGRLLRRESERSAELRSLAADLARRQEEQARQAVHTERLRIARELHDTVAHTVSVMTLQAGGVRRRLDVDPSRHQERDVLLGVEGLGREAVDELHRLLGVLRAPDETEGGTGPNLTPQPRLRDLPRLADRLRTAGVPVDLVVEGEPRPLPAGVELAGYRVVQEALTNVLKHGRGATARVVVRYGHIDVSLVVEDRGGLGPGATGPPDRLPPAGLGLRGIHERVSLYGGTVEAGPVPPDGFAVRVTLPAASNGTS